MAVKDIKQKMRFLARTPFHPQWLMRGNREQLAGLLAGLGGRKRVLDVGCFDSWPKSCLQDSCDYVGLDYYETAIEWYESVPNVFGDARSLPFDGESFDAALLLDVLEHIEDSGPVLDELNRVLKPGGELILSIPFLYPLHDEPRDFVRLTRHGLSLLAEKSNFVVSDSASKGSPLTTSGLLLAIAISKMSLNLLERKSPWVIFVPLLLTLVPLVNLLAWLLSTLEPEDAFMPYGYHVRLVKAGEA